MSSCPTFSIVTVTWRDLPGLVDTAASVHAQTCTDLEWIVVDGGSNDGTAQWLEANSGPLCDWTSEPDKGTYDAMNKGLDRCRGRYVLFLNGGDALAGPETLARIRSALDRTTTQPDLVYGDSIDTDAGGIELYRAARRHQWLPNGMFTSHQSMLFRRDHAPALRYDLRFPTSADYAFVAAFVAGADTTFLYIPEPFCRFALGGTHFVKRGRGMQEDYRIRREVLRLAPTRAAALYAMHAMHHALKLATPALARLLRYTRARDAR